MTNLDYQPIKPPPATRYAWLVVGMLFFVALLNYMDRLMIAHMGDPIKKDLGINNEQFGNLSAYFLWTYAIFSPLGGFIADRFGKARIIILSLVVWSLATLATGFVTSYSALLTTRIVMGFSEACYIPAGLALIADYHRGPTRSFATGVHMVGIYVGAAAGGLGGFFAQHYGWHFAFQLFGAIGALYGFVLIAFLRDAQTVPTANPRQPESVEPSSKSSPLGEVAGERGGTPPDEGNRPTVPETAETKPSISAIATSLFTSPAFLLLLFINILVGCANWGINGWLSTFIKESFKLSMTQAGLYATVPVQIASFVGVLSAAALSDSWARTNRAARAWIPAIAFIIAGPCLVGAASTSAFAFAITGLCVYGLARGAFDANQMPLLRQIIPERFSATGYGCLNFIGTATGGAMIKYAGKLKDQNISFSIIFQACGLALVLTGIILALIALLNTRKSPTSPVPTLEPAKA